MKKTIITICIAILFILTSTITVSSIEENSEEVSKDQVYHIVISNGPAWSKIFTKIEFIDGDQEQINQVKALLARHKMGKNEEYVNVDHLTIKVTYRFFKMPFSRYNHKTIFTKINYSEFQDFQDIRNLDDLKVFIKNSTETIRKNTNYKLVRKHTITYENFTGAFVLYPSKIARFLPPKLFVPARFMLIGACENLKVK